MQPLKFLLCTFLFVNLANAQEYQAGTKAEGYKVFANDTIFASKTIFQSIENSQQFSVMAKIFTLTGVQADIDKLGMCTVFLPTDQAFATYDEEGLKKLLSSSNKDALKAAVLSHVIQGRVDQNSLARNIKQNSGTAYFRSPADLDPEFQLMGAKVVLSLPGAPKAEVIDVNYYHKSGFLHIVNAFLLPNE